MDALNEIRRMTRERNDPARLAFYNQKWFLVRSQLNTTYIETDPDFAPLAARFLKEGVGRKPRAVPPAPTILGELRRKIMLFREKIDPNDPTVNSMLFIVNEPSYTMENKAWMLAKLVLMADAYAGIVQTLELFLADVAVDSILATRALIARLATTLSAMPDVFVAAGALHTAALSPEINDLEFLPLANSFREWSIGKGLHTTELNLWIENLNILMNPNLEFDDAAIAAFFA